MLMWLIVSIIFVLLLVEIVRCFITVEPFIFWRDNQKAPFRKNMKSAKNRMIYRIVLAIGFVAASGFLVFAVYSMFGGN